MKFFVCLILFSELIIPFCCCASDDSIQQGFSSEFAYTLGSTMEEGFFGGVKWGVAAALYHVFYRIMAFAVSGVPHAVLSLKAWYAYWADTYAGRPPVLNIH